MNRIPRVYYSGELKPHALISLNEDASHHLLRVLRLKPQQSIILFNGDETEYLAELLSVEAKKAQLKILSVQNKTIESPLKIFLAQGISRGERMDYTLQKSVELGVYEIIPLFTERCGVELKGERLEKRILHWQQVVISACEQSGRCYVPEVKMPQRLEAWLQQLKVDLMLAADPKSTHKLKDFQAELNTVALLCGSEGGFSEHELKLMREYKVQGFSLGPRILRTETAALTAISLMQQRWGDL